MFTPLRSPLLGQTTALNLSSSRWKRRKVCFVHFRSIRALVQGGLFLMLIQFHSPALDLMARNMESTGSEHKIKVRYSSCSYFVSPVHPFFASLLAPLNPQWEYHWGTHCSLILFIFFPVELSILNENNYVNVPGPFISASLLFHSSFLPILILYPS